MLKAQAGVLPGLNRWLNPWFSDPAALEGLTPPRRLLRALFVSARNLLFLAGGLLAVMAAAGLLPAFVVIPAGIGTISYLCWRIRLRDRAGEEVSAARLLLLFALVIMMLAYLRSMADEAGVNPRYEYVIDLDKALFGTVPTVWLQDRLYAAGRITPLDAFTSVIYFSYFTVPLIAGVILWHEKPRGLRLFVTATLVTILIGSPVFMLVPTAPPWLAGLNDYLPAVSRIAPEVMNTVRPGFYDQGYQAVGINDVAAFPSYHTAQTLLVAFIAWRYSRRLGLIGAGYSLLMGFSLVYLGEHYVSDVLAGVGVAFVAWAVALRLTPARLKVLEGQTAAPLQPAEAPASPRAA
jgi:membrane-associated phospholipid phosphatase